MKNINKILASYKTLAGNLTSSSLKVSVKRPIITYAKAMARSISIKIHELEILLTRTVGFWCWLKNRAKVKVMLDKIKTLSDQLVSWCNVSLCSAVWCEASS